MILLQRFIPLLSTVFMGVLWWFIFLHRDFYVTGVLGLILISFLSLAQLFEWRIFTKQFFSFLAVLVFLCASLSLFFLFLDSSLLRYFCLFLSLLAHLIFLESCFAYLHHAKGYQPYALANVSALIHLFTLWLFFNTVFGFLTFLQFSPWIFLAIIPTMVFIVTSQMYAMYNIPLRQSIVFLFMITLLITEMFFALSFLPLVWLVSGLSLLCVYFFFSSVGRYYLLKSLDSSIMMRYGSLTFFLLLTILLTAQWI